MPLLVILQPCPLVSLWEQHRYSAWYAFKKNRTLYDEKQQHDLSAAGIIVFPFKVFTTLLIFSSAVLVNFKRG